jgi:hypothetical protein
MARMIEFKVKCLSLVFNLDFPLENDLERQPFIGPPPQTLKRNETRKIPENEALS